MKFETGSRFWITTTVIVVLFSLFFIGQHLVHAFGIKRDISRLRREGAQYRQRIEEDSTLVEQLRYDDYLEAYAREHFRMQRLGEKVYLLKE